MNISLDILTDREATPVDRMLALNDIMEDARTGFILPDDEAAELGRFIWSCGNLDAWLAIGGIVILGNCAMFGSDIAASWLQNLSTQATGQVRLAASNYLVQLGVILG